MLTAPGAQAMSRVRLQDGLVRDLMLWGVVAQPLSCTSLCHLSLGAQAMSRVRVQDLLVRDLKPWADPGGLPFTAATREQVCVCLCVCVCVCMCLYVCVFMRACVRACV